MLPLASFAAFVGGVVAAVAGFGIGSLVTPALAVSNPAKLAVAAVSVPHFIATAYRFWLIRDHVDMKVLRSFGVMSAAGGFAGAIINYFAVSRALEVLLACLLLFVGVGGLLGWTKRLRFVGPWAWAAGALSGLLGGLVGNQGGIRAGAMTGLGVSRDAFVATSTAIGLVVDGARMPVYLVGQWHQLIAIWPAIAAMVAAVLVGTFFGMKILRRIPEAQFMRVVQALLIGLAIWLLAKP